MASARDIQDIFDLGQQAARPKKKAKRIEAQARLSGMSREVQLLMGDSVPPVALVEAPKYKSKPTISNRVFRVRHWEERSFVHLARNDGLKLRHWKRSIPIAVSHTSTNATSDVEMTDGESKSPAVAAVQFEDEHPHEKWDVKVEVPEYSDEQYDKHFKAEDWTKEETDYLLDLAQTYDLRWIVIADRYDPLSIPKPSFTGSVEDSATPSSTEYPQRTMEALKSRYYTISAKMLEVQIPVSNMTATQFQLWERMKNFDAKTELTRKAMAEKLFERTKEEADEERVLLEELARIARHEEDFIKMRKDLYSRLETAPSLRRNDRGEEQSTALYQTSQGLSMLLSTLLAKEKRLKRPLPGGTDAGASASTPTDTKGRQMHPPDRRETIDSLADEAAPSKKGSVSQPVVKLLTPAEELKYGVSHPSERLTSGVTFRHEKINRVTTAKSQVQTQKIQSALTELGIPARLLMPTERVCREFERLVAEVQLLLDAQRTLEKVQSEVKILQEHKRIRLGEPLSIKSTAADGKDMDKATTNGDSKTDVDTFKKEEVEDSQTGVTQIQPNDNASIVPADKGKFDEPDGEVDDTDADAEGDRSALAENAEDQEVDDSFAVTQDEDDQDEDNNDEEEEDEDDVDAQVEEDDEEDDGSDAPGLDDLERATRVTDDEDEEDNGRAEEDEDEIEDIDDDDEVAIGESDVEGKDDEEDAEDGMEVDDDNNEDDDEDDELNGEEESIKDHVTNDDQYDEGDAETNADAEEETPRPASSPSAAAQSHKRSASVISDTSKAESSRSGIGRKKRR